MRKIAMLGTGLIGMWYVTALHHGRSRDQVRIVYSRTAARAQAFAEQWGIPAWTTDLTEAIGHPEVDVVVVGLPNHRHEEAVLRAAEHGKAVLCTKPLGRNAAEAKRMLDAVEGAGVLHGYLEDLAYTPKVLKALASVRGGAIGRCWCRAGRTPAHSIVLGRRRRRGDHRHGEPLHRGVPQLHRQGRAAAGGHVLGRDAGAPDPCRGPRDRAGALRQRRGRPVRGELGVPGRMDLRDGWRARRARSGLTTGCAPGSRCSRPWASGGTWPKSEGDTGCSRWATK